jgi:hypothetical protein
MIEIAFVFFFIISVISRGFPKAKGLTAAVQPVVCVIGFLRYEEVSRLVSGHSSLFLCRCSPVTRHDVNLPCHVVSVLLRRRPS